MKERPILFNAEMVLALLDGRKTQTRRVVKGSWLPIVEECLRVNGKWVFETFEYDLTTPYGEIGDRLWVRETFFSDWDGKNKYRWVHYAADESARQERLEDHDKRPLDSQIFKSGATRFKPSIHMPRWASRITLEIVNIRVERIQDISEEDAKAEGFSDPYDSPNASKKWFQRVWDSLNAKRGFGWMRNPFVWIIEFKRIK